MYSEQRDHAMCKVVTYKRFKTMKEHKNIRQKVAMVTFFMRGGHTRGSNNNNNNNNVSTACNIYFARVVAGKNLVFCIGGHYKREVVTNGGSK